MVAAVMAMAISYNWLFQWDYTFYKWVLLVLRTGISGHNCGINIRKKIFGFRIFARDIPSGYVKMAIENGDL